MKTIALFALGTLASLPFQAPAPAPSQSLLARRYDDGARLVYRMRGENNGTTYVVRLRSVVSRGSDGRLGEEYAFVDLGADGQERPMSPAASAFRTRVTLEPGGAPFDMPDLSKAQGLVGPVLDLVSFYADVFLAMHVNLERVGDHQHVPQPAVTASWADGTRVLIGEDAVDFDITLTALDHAAGEVTLTVNHVPPAEPKIKIPAEWMRPPVADSPNNWVQVERSGDAYIAAVGKETFDVLLRIRLSDGVILSATMENPVVTTERRCRDAALQQCDDARPGRVFRRIEMTLESEEKG